MGDQLAINVGRRRVLPRIAGQVYDPNGPSLWTSRQTLGRVAGLGVYNYRIGVQPGVSPQRYTAALSRRLDLSIGCMSPVNASAPPPSSTLVQACFRLAP